MLTFVYKIEDNFMLYLLVIKLASKAIFAVYLRYIPLFKINRLVKQQRQQEQKKARHRSRIFLFCFIVEIFRD